jgi:hypothetical protein
MKDANLKKELNNMLKKAEQAEKQAAKKVTLRATLSPQRCPWADRLPVAARWRAHWCRSPHTDAACGCDACVSTGQAGRR